MASGSEVYWEVALIVALSVLVLLVLWAARVRYRRYRRKVKARAARMRRAGKLLDALAGTLRATANPDATPATNLDPETDTLVRNRDARPTSSFSKKQNPLVACKLLVCA